MAAPRRILTQDEMRAIWSDLDFLTPEGLASGLLLSGCRLASLTQLRRRDVRLDGTGASLHISEAGKSHWSYQRLLDDLGIPLMRHALSLVDPESPLFDLSVGQIRHAFLAAARSAGVEGASVAAIRRSIAVAAFAADVPLPAIQAMLGVRTTWHGTRHHMVMTTVGTGIETPDTIGALRKLLGHAHVTTTARYLAGRPIRKRVDTITDGQLATMLEEADGKARLAIALMAHGALRTVEAAELRFADIAHEGDAVVVTVRYPRGGHRVVTREPLRGLLLAERGNPDQLVLGWTPTQLAKVIRDVFRSAGI